MDVPSASQPAVRSVEIEPPSARAETWNVLRAAALIALATWIYVADTTVPAGAGAAATQGAAGPAATNGAEAGAAAASGAGVDTRDLLPYQRLFRTLDGEDQRLFRELQEGLLEAENVRSSARAWPAPAALAAQGVPPFADLPGRGGRRDYRWLLRQQGPVVNYLGLAGDARDPSFLLLVLEPDPLAPAAGLAPPAAAGPPGGGAGAVGGVLAQATDEVHHRLADGTLLHVSIWMRAAPAAAAGAVAAPAGDDPGLMAEPYTRGWVQLLAGTARR